MNPDRREDYIDRESGSFSGPSSLVGGVANLGGPAMDSRPYHSIIFRVVWLDFTSLFYISVGF